MRRTKSRHHSQQGAHILRELKQKVPVTQVSILADDAHYLKAAVARLGLDFRCVAMEIETSSFSNTFSHMEPTHIREVGMDEIKVEFQLGKEALRLII